MHSMIDVVTDVVPRPVPPATFGLPDAASRSGEVRSGAGDLERAVPGIRARLKARYDDLEPPRSKRACQQRSTRAGAGSGYRSSA